MFESLAGSMLCVYNPLPTVRLLPTVNEWSVASSSVLRRYSKFNVVKSKALDVTTSKSSLLNTGFGLGEGVGADIVLSWSIILFL